MQVNVLVGGHEVRGKGQEATLGFSAVTPQASGPSPRFLDRF